MRNRKTRKKDWLDLSDLAKICRAKNIKSNTEYQLRYKEIPGAPRILSRTYEDYNTWYEFIRMHAENEDPSKLKKLDIYHLSDE